MPAQKGIEVSCTAGITAAGDWIRLFPVPYRFLDEDKRFKKYQWIDVNVTRATNDPRPESFKLNADSIVIGNSVSSANEWRARREIVSPLIKRSLCDIQRCRDESLYPTLGLFKPRKIERLVIEEETAEWSTKQLADLKQTLLFQKTPAQTLEKIPFSFKYEFLCSEDGCKGHCLTCTDWEVGQSYRRWRKEYGADWERAFRVRYEKDMISKYDTYFYVGTIHQYPNAWIIVGLFYPPPRKMNDLFDRRA